MVKVIEKPVNSFLFIFSIDNHSLKIKKVEWGGGQEVQRVLVLAGSDHHGFLLLLLGLLLLFFLGLLFGLLLGLLVGFLLVLLLVFLVAVEVPGFVTETEFAEGASPLFLSADEEHPAGHMDEGVSQLLIHEELEVLLELGSEGEVGQ